MRRHRVQAAVADCLMADRQARDVAAVADGVTDAWVHTLGPVQPLVALRPGSGRLTEELTDADMRPDPLMRHHCGTQLQRSAVRQVRQLLSPGGLAVPRRGG
ncbi:hypothetical protein GCM10010207_85520 [Streptomyces atratus]|nr:hypothetical protein GCM10010207_85520 [Streptomyces atratus]